MLYDLSQPLCHDGPQWATYASTVITRENTIDVHGFNAERATLTTHTGTHVDAPFHFCEDGEAIEQLPLEYFIGHAIAIDVRPKDPGSRIDVKDLEPLRGVQQRELFVLIKSGWAERRARTKEFLLQFPYLSAEAAQFLVDQGVKGVGTECLSVGGFEPGTGAPPHLVLLGAKKLIIEDLFIPEALLDGKLRWFAAFPVKIEGAGGAWTRAVAWDAGDFS